MAQKKQESQLIWRKELVTCLLQLLKCQLHEFCRVLNGCQGISLRGHFHQLGIPSGAALVSHSVNLFQMMVPPKKQQKAAVTPAKKAATPAKKAATPAKKAVTPAKKAVATPAKKAVAPSPKKAAVLGKGAKNGKNAKKQESEEEDEDDEEDDEEDEDEEEESGKLLLELISFCLCELTKVGLVL